MAPAGLKFALIIFGLLSRFYPQKSNDHYNRDFPIENLGFYAASNIELVPKTDFVLQNFFARSRQCESESRICKQTNGLTFKFACIILLCGDVSMNPGPIR